jgi:hypothetical protein
LRPGWWTSLPRWNMPRRSCQVSVGVGILDGMFLFLLDDEMGRTGKSMVMMIIVNGITEM